ncbi:MAG: hypothetical protein WBN75_07365, partial [Verrucomicrobiia bacterium]
PAEPEPACEPENPVARSRRKSHLPNVQKSKFEKLALFSTYLTKKFGPARRAHSKFLHPRSTYSRADLSPLLITPSEAALARFLV